MKRSFAMPLMGVVIGAFFAASPAQSETIVYSNITTGPTAGYSKPAGYQIGDNLLLTSGGILDSVSFSVFNGTTSLDFLRTADLTVDFWNYSGTPGIYNKVGTLIYNDYTLGLDVGDYTTLSFANISNTQSILLKNDILAVLTITDMTGGADTAGQLLYNPPTIGSSGDWFYQDSGTGFQWMWFGGQPPIANFYWQVGVNKEPIPEPATCLLIGTGLAGLAAFRRKKF